jgi:hypothetical protein
MAAVPYHCAELERKFQDEVNALPDLPDTIQMHPSHGEWSSTQRYIKKIIQDSHVSHIEHMDHPNWANNPNEMARGLFTELLSHLRDNTNYTADSPFRAVIWEYALKVQRTDNAVVKCIRDRHKYMGRDLTSAKRVGLAKNLPEDVEGIMGQFLTGKKGTTDSQMDQLRQDNKESLAPRPSGRPTGGRRKTKKSKRRARKTRRRNK